MSAQPTNRYLERAHAINAANGGTSPFAHNPDAPSPVRIATLDHVESMRGQIHAERDASRLEVVARIDGIENDVRILKLVGAVVMLLAVFALLALKGCA